MMFLLSFLVLKQTRSVFKSFFVFEYGSEHICKSNLAKLPVSNQLLIIKNASAKSLCYFINTFVIFNFADLNMSL